MFPGKEVQGIGHRKTKKNDWVSSTGKIIENYYKIYCEYIMKITRCPYSIKNETKVLIMHSWQVVTHYHYLSFKCIVPGGFICSEYLVNVTFTAPKSSDSRISARMTGPL